MSPQITFYSVFIQLDTNYTETANS